MTRDEALAIAEGLREDRASLHAVADELMKLWDEGFAAGDLDGYSNGYANGYTDGFKDAGRVGENEDEDGTARGA